TSGGKQGQQSITVTPIPVASLTVTPTIASLAIGATQQLTATTLDANGNTLSGRAVTWGTSDATKATVSASGLVTAVVRARATITATSETKTGTATITVSPIPVATVTVTPTTASLAIGATQQLTATTLDANGNTLSGRAVTWGTSDATKATVSASGLVTAVVRARATITATSETKTGTATITVSPIPVATVTVTPTTATLVIGATQQLTAATLDANGNTLSGRAVTWGTSDATKATVSASGLVTAVAPGTATITATSETKTGTATITVNPIPVATVTVTPATATLVIGATQQLTAATLDANGNTLSGRTVTWGTSDATKATVNASGLVTAVAPGTATITATSETKTGTATITVNPIPVATVTVTPATATLVIGATQQLAATLKDANGNVLTGQSI